jgi:hypothetical protein
MNGDAAMATAYDEVALRALMQAAGEAGAEHALERLGLADESARDDVRELRELLGAWRDAKKSAWKAAIDWAVRGCLGARPVRAITLVEGLPADGGAVLLPVDAYAINIDGGGEGLVRVMRPGISGRMRVTYRAGMATSAGEVPEALRQGIMLRAAHILRLRDDAEVGANDEAEALWSPWRRLRLS